MNMENFLRNEVSIDEKNLENKNELVWSKIFQVI